MKNFKSNSIFCNFKKIELVNKNKNTFKFTNMMTEEIQQPKITIAGKGLVKINTDRNVDGRLKRGGKYIMHLPETDEIIDLVCRGIAIRAADMTILKHTKNGKPVTSDLNCTFGYQFENYNTVCFSSWNYREKCELYAIEDIYVMHDSLDALFVEDVKVEIS
ncbi:MAG: hypothetical protein EBY20_00340 [Alphaproteobacteria bacterium]|uniref:Uncharacterized protein n=1 Tax=viral metagenome TaxID=1070528 RepID=A0A6C0HQ25_9ZZZZ|nr:hypothetical protein [Alphaproteobacteria bacterium]